MKKRKSFEAAILDSYAKGRLRSAAPSRAEVKRYRAAAAAALAAADRIRAMTPKRLATSSTELIRADRDGR